ncbi:MAG: PqqD family protein [Bacteroidales bacterium]
MKINRNIAISESGSLFNPITGDFFTLNPVGVEIFHLIKEENSTLEIMKKVLTKYDIDQHSFERDYFEFTGFLRKYNLIESEN